MNSEGMMAGGRGQKKSALRMPPVGLGWFPMALETSLAMRSPDRECPPLGLPIPPPGAKHGRNEVAGGGKKNQSSVSSR